MSSFVSSFGPVLEMRGRRKNTGGTTPGAGPVVPSIPATPSPVPPATRPNNLLSRLRRFQSKDGETPATEGTDSTPTPPSSSQAQSPLAFHVQTPTDEVSSEAPKRMAYIGSSLGDTNRVLPTGASMSETALPSLRKQSKAKARAPAPVQQESASFNMAPLPANLGFNLSAGEAMVAHAPSEGRQRSGAPRRLFCRRVPDTPHLLSPQSAEAAEDAMCAFSSLEVMSSADRICQRCLRILANIELVGLVCSGRAAQVVRGLVEGRHAGLRAIRKPVDLDDFSAPEIMQMLLVVTMEGDDDTTRAIVEGLRDACGWDFALYVVLLEYIDPACASASARALSMQASMLSKGADDVVFNAKSSEDLIFLISMSNQRRRKRIEDLETQRDELRALLKEDMKKKVITVRDTERAQGIIWQVVHDLFEDFPALDDKLSVELKVGAQVGPCSLDNELGKGAFGRVYGSWNAEAKRREAVKVVPKSCITHFSQVMDLWHEASLQGRLRHPNIVSLLGMLHGPRHIFFRLEEAGRQNLFAVLKSQPDKMLPLSEARGIQQQLVGAIHHCHMARVAHRDLKPENISVIAGESTSIKILDFGQSVNSRERQTDVAGTFPFIAPEVFDADTAGAYAPTGVDVWASGVILLEMSCGLHRLTRLMGWGKHTSVAPERRAELENALADKQLLHNAVKDHLGDEPPALIEMLDGLLEVNPSLRWNAEQMRAAKFVRGARQHEHSGAQSPRSDAHAVSATGRSPTCCPRAVFESALFRIAQYTFRPPR
eukprot:CAMPEP_0170328504 /NCGR_PEP_ID=MMETSP0116_2-20130129/65158_1 /TAXON_ID=400756 /ORGANISM="Durinskia baltica, Strain CSIRO CS-38" /LENGTH=770 /DNA_ID=CAMNT_0010581619 /DNA_START=1 /DNA_END=2311 /DNA_ORIENTATION=+